MIDEKIKDKLEEFKLAKDKVNRKLVIEVGKTLNIRHTHDVIITKDDNMSAMAGMNINPEIVNIKKSIKGYENLNQLRKYVLEYAKENIKGKIVINKDTNIEIEFSNKGISKTFSGRTIEEKLQTVNMLERIVENGIYFYTTYELFDKRGFKYHYFLTPVSSFNGKNNAFIRSVIIEQTKNISSKNKFYYHQFEYIDTK